ncbi:MAG TPA: ATP synthase F1 subunit gamma [Bryobacteraceae bacterium]|nr:ATP synthase F1 subunit gamma [Bryobacteraceae bacterium]
MPSLIDIRRRVRSVKNTQQITKAMKMVSAAKLRRAQDQAIAARPYGVLLRQMLANVAQGAANDPDAGAHPLLAVRPEQRILLVVITADSGLAGAFNSNLIKLAHRFADEHGNATLSFELIGKKGVNYFRRRYPNIAGTHTDLFRRVKFEDAERIANLIISRFEASEVDSVYLFTNEFKNAMAPALTSTRILPIEVPKTTATVDYIYEQNPGELLGSLLPRYVKLLIYRAFLESVAAEHVARMVAMEAATKNAGDVIDKLTLLMNRVRQASITREIIEIVSGASALE